MSENVNIVLYKLGTYKKLCQPGNSTRYAWTLNNMIHK